MCVYCWKRWRRYGRAPVNNAKESRLWNWMTSISKKLFFLRIENLLKSQGSFKSFIFFKWFVSYILFFVVQKKNGRRFLNDLNIDRFHPLSPRRSFSPNWFKCTTPSPPPPQTDFKTFIEKGRNWISLHLSLSFFKILLLLICKWFGCKLHTLDGAGMDFYIRRVRACLMGKREGGGPRIWLYKCTHIRSRAQKKKMKEKFV